MAVNRLLRPLIFFFSIFLVLCSMAHSIPQSEALLKFKSSLTNTETLDSWNKSSEPCNNGANWDGVICYKGIVTGLRLGDMNLGGKIDVDALLEIPGLRTVSFVNNNFSGPIPAFNRLGVLKAIYLTGNQFSGEIPQEFFAKMKSLKKLWLPDNEFSGPIPTSLGQSSRLIELHLENNQFSGEIPTFNGHSLTSLNVSNNKLEGEIPPALSKFNSSSFAGNPGLCGATLGKDCAKPPAEQPTSQSNTTGSDDAKESSSSDQDSNNCSKLTKVLIALLVVGVLILIIALVLTFGKRRRRDATEDFSVLEKERSEDSVPKNVRVPSRKETQLSRKGSGQKGSTHGKNSGIGDLVLLKNDKGQFGLADLMKAAAEVLGNGSLGLSYKAVMSNGLAVVVKRIREVNGKGKDEFDAEMRELGKLQHPNILSPLGYHYRKDEKLLVYEYMPKGSLIYLLHGDRGPSHSDFDWPARLRVIKGIARGIGYLHSELASSELPHGNLKSSNVLLGNDFEPLLADFGFISLISTSNVSQALFAYKAPEAIQYGQISPKCDVYCLGILILEILTGKFPSQYLNNGKGGTDVIQWVRSAILEGRQTELLDPEIAGSTSSLGEMKKLLHLGAACTESNPQQRIDMNEAISRIEEIQLEGNLENGASHGMSSGDFTESAVSLAHAPSL